MKKRIALITLSVLVLVSLFLFSNKNQAKEYSQNNSRVIHKQNLEKSPFKDAIKLSKQERISAGLPPNKYYEQEWELTMNPALGRPTSENLALIRAVQKEKSEIFLNAKAPGEVGNSWIERGPNNVGGRTRAVMFDPNDTTNETVFAGGISGGLWKNNNISNANSGWIRVDIPENLAVSCITFDPNNLNIFYLGTGESYVGGDVNGDGVWKSEDAGTTWSKVFGGITGPSIKDIKVNNITIDTPFNIGGDYVSRPSTFFGAEITSVITADFILANGSVPFTGINGIESTDPLEGCGPSTIDMTGKIALIRRGVCSFIEQVKAAQDAGAIGVVIMNNVDENLIDMDGNDNSITIPAVMISQADGNIIEEAANLGIVTGSLNPETVDFEGLVVPGIQFINDIKVRNNAGVSEVYVAAGDGLYIAASIDTYLTGPEFGLYKSTDAGNNWNEIEMPLTNNGKKHCPNDIEIGIDNNIWVSTTRSFSFENGGGKIFRSIDGTNFILKRTIPSGLRTQIAVSSSNPETLYVLAQINSNSTPVRIEKTEDGFLTNENLPLPNDADSGIPANDFARGQSFYNLLLELDPNNDATVYVGGIDLFKSNTGGSNWDQISKWSNNNDLAGLNIPLVHADHHALTFANGSSTVMVFGNDGGVYYSNTSGSSIDVRTKDFNTSQFYTVSAGPTALYNGEVFAGGLQDNGTRLFDNANPNQTSPAIEVFGGDGAATFFDKDGTDRYLIVNFVYNRAVALIDFNDNNNYIIINRDEEFNGAFINPQALDSNLDILYSNFSSDGNSIIRRYSGIKSQSTVQGTDISDSQMNSAPTAFKVSPYTTTSSTLLVGTLLGDIFKVENADGASPIFTKLDLSNDIVGSVSDIEFGSNENEIFVTIHNYGVQSIWYTNDGGTLWQEKEGDLPDLPVKTILKNPLNSNEVIIGTELGVWSTNNFFDASPNWNQAFNGMSNVKVTDLDIRDDNKIFAATFGRGVFSGEFKFDDNGDDDGDGVLNSVDNCLNTANADQADADGNGIGDACQDTDNDLILDINDNCPTTANTDQADTNGDGIGDVCEDLDGDGVFDPVDNCLDIANADQADTNGNGIGDACDTSYLNADNISLEIISETCAGENNGKIIVNINETFVTYTATVVGNGLNLSEQITSSTYAFNEIAVGSYTVCVAVNGTTYKQCFEVNIETAEVITLKIANNKDSFNTTSVNVSSGTAPFTVLFNNEVIKITSNLVFDLDLVGSGALEIKTAKACEGTFKTTIENVFNIIASPNPVINTLKITLPNTVTQSTISVEIYNVNGKLIRNTNYNNSSNALEVPFANLNSGLYFIKLNLETPEVIKIIKK